MQPPVIVAYGGLTKYWKCSFYTECIAKSGFIGIALAQSPEYVAPYGGTSAIFGTNPIAISIPVNQGQTPITFDMATSAMAW